jgi:predicted GTPase
MAKVAFETIFRRSPSVVRAIHHTTGAIFMRREVTSLVLRALAYALPVVALAAVGIAWLFEHDRWIAFSLATVAIASVLLIMSRLLGRSGHQRSPSPPPVATWSDAGQKAWEDVDQLAARSSAAPPAFGDATAYQNLFREVLSVVGRRFHPTSLNPGLELTVSQAMEIAERALRDMRREVVDATPLVRNLTLARIAWAHRQASTYGPAIARAGFAAIFVNRIRRWIVAWPVAVANEVVNLLDVSPAQIASHQVSKIAVDRFVRHVGAYCIQAFSGQASLDIASLHAVANDAPLRILILGPLNAGKSSLMNAMFGQERSKRDILPCPTLKEEHVLDRDDVPRAIILDSDGFGGAGDEAAQKRVFEAIESVDLIIAVTSARHAARQLECRILDEVRRRFANSTHRSCPPMIVAATHIDLLQPAQEWQPPYDFLDGDSPKEQSVRGAVDAIANDFQISLDRVVPVCLSPGAEYNVEEAFLPVLGAVLPEADRVKFLRLVEVTRSREARDRVGRGIALLVKAGSHIIESMIR